MFYWWPQFLITTSCDTFENRSLIVYPLTGIIDLFSLASPAILPCLQITGVGPPADLVLRMIVICMGKWHWDFVKECCWGAREKQVFHGPRSYFESGWADK